MTIVQTPRRITTVALATLIYLFGPACGPPDSGNNNNGGSSGRAGSGGSSAAGSSGAGSTGTAGSAGGTTQVGTGGSAGTTTGAAGSTATGGTSGGGDLGTPIALPLVVTQYYTNQGWFADAEIEKSFSAAMKPISQGESSSGACAMRNAAAKGKCFKVAYTPPSGLTDMSHYVGVFFLTTLKSGQANWGTEVAKAVAAGATKISFWAAADMATPMPTIAFKAGVMDKDKFSISDQVKTLTTTWTQYTIPLTDPYDGTMGVVGPFAWVISGPDSMKPATFYLDGIVWE